MPEKPRTESEEERIEASVRSDLKNMLAAVFFIKPAAPGKETDAILPFIEKPFLASEAYMEELRKRGNESGDSHYADPLQKFRFRYRRKIAEIDSIVDEANVVRVRMLQSKGNGINEKDATELQELMKKLDDALKN